MTTGLLRENCVPCRRDDVPLTQAEWEELHTHAPEWSLIIVEDVPRLQRTVPLPTYKEALLFTQKVGELAEEQGHHPRIITEFDQVTVEWWTHAINGLHRNDFLMAVRVDDLLARWEFVSGRRDVVEEASDESFPASDPPGY